MTDRKDGTYTKACKDLDEKFAVLSVESRDHIKSWFMRLAMDAYTAGLEYQKAHGSSDASK